MINHAHPGANAFLPSCENNTTLHITDHCLKSFSKTPATSKQPGWNPINYTRMAIVMQERLSG